MSYFVKNCGTIDASTIPEIYDIYHNNIDNYMATSVGAPSQQYDFGGQDFTSSGLVGNSIIDSILDQF